MMRGDRPGRVHRLEIVYSQERQLFGAAQLNGRCLANTSLPDNLMALARLHKEGGDVRVRLTWLLGDSLPDMGRALESNTTLKKAFADRAEIRGYVKRNLPPGATPLIESITPGQCFVTEWTVINGGPQELVVVPGGAQGLKQHFYQNTGWVNKAGDLPSQFWAAPVKMLVDRSLRGTQ